MARFVVSLHELGRLWGEKETEMRFTKVFLFVLMSSLVMPAIARVSGTDLSSYRHSVEEWRQRYETSLKSDDGWLAAIEGV